MSFDTSFFAFPSDVTLWTLLDSSENAVDFIQFIGHYFQSPDSRRTTTSQHMSYNRTIELCNQCLQKHPELPSLFVDTGNFNTHHQIHYLLSAIARDEVPTASDLVFEEVLNGSYFRQSDGERIEVQLDNMPSSESGDGPARADGGGGMPIGFLPASLVRQAASALESMDIASFGHHYDPVKCWFYKSEPKLGAFSERTELHELFIGFKQFFINAATYGYAAFRVTVL